MTRPDRYWLHGLEMTLGLYVLVAVAIADTFGLFCFIMLGTLALSVPLFYRVFPGSHFTTIALTNFLAIYACLFTFFTESKFATAADWALHIAFVLPIAAFLAGAWLRRKSIHQLIRHEEERFVHSSPYRFIWPTPVFAVGAASFLLPYRTYDVEAVNLLLVASSGLIGALVRAIAAMQIIIGVWLIIFGFSGALRYARECDWREQRRPGHH